jgi:hypothetical protein
MFCSVECLFWSRFDKSGGPDACWLWTGPVIPDTGYGGVNDYVGGGKRTSAHRRAYRLACVLLLHHIIPPSQLYFSSGGAIQNLQDLQQALLLINSGALKRSLRGKMAISFVVPELRSPSYLLYFSSCPCSSAIHFTEYLPFPFFCIFYSQNH